MTYPVLEESCHEPAAQLLSKADNPVLGAGVDLEIEPLGGGQVVDKDLALSLSIGLQEGTEFGVPDEGVGGGDMVHADLVDDVLGFAQQILLGLTVTGCGDYCAQLLVDLQ